MKQLQAFGNLQQFEQRSWIGVLSGRLAQRQGRYERAFVRWCRRHSHQCIRTVDLFGAFAFQLLHTRDRFSAREIRKRWETKKWVRERLLEGRRRHGFILVKPNAKIGFCACYVGVPRKGRLVDYINRAYPDPKPWPEYYRSARNFARRELERYQRAVAFWKTCGSEMQQDFLRCLSYSNRRPETHPDYLVRFRTKFPDVPCVGFVEVKGPWESLRPSQKRFFPELVTKARQRVWVARVEGASRIRFGRFNSKGQLEPCSTPGR